MKEGWRRGGRVGGGRGPGGGNVRGVWVRVNVAGVRDDYRR